MRIEPFSFAFLERSAPLLASVLAQVVTGDMPPATSWSSVRTVPGSKSISITDDAHHFCITLEDAGNRLTALKEAIAIGKYPIAMELVNSCAKWMTGQTVKYHVTQHDAEKFLHSLDKTLHH